MPDFSTFKRLDFSGQGQLIPKIYKVIHYDFLFIIIFELVLFKRIK